MTETRGADVSETPWSPTPAQLAVLKTFFAIQEHGHFSPESQAACREMIDEFNREQEDEK